MNGFDLFPSMVISVTVTVDLNHTVNRFNLMSARAAFVNLRKILIIGSRSQQRRPEDGSGAVALSADPLQCPRVFPSRNYRENGIRRELPSKNYWGTCPVPLSPKFTFTLLDETARAADDV